MAKIGPACVCGYEADSQADLDEHIVAAARADPDNDHAEAH